MAVGFGIPLICMFFTLLAADISAPAPDCSSLALNMADCLSYVTAGGTAKKPEGTCCSGLKTVLKTDADCLCDAFKNSAQLGVTLNVTKALALPAACHVSAPSVTNCGLNSGTAPALSPSPTSASIGANEAAPEPSPGKSASSAVTISMELLLFATLVAASYASF